MGKCELWKTCTNYRDDSIACSNDDEARNTCGIRKESLEGKDRIATLDFVIEVLKEHEKALDAIAEKLESLIAKRNKSNAFVVYGNKGQPLAYLIKTGNEDFTGEEMSTIMDLFSAQDNAETEMEWRELV